MNFISKINQFLLERHPNIWNTKLVWMILINLFLHLIFFFIGFFLHKNPETLQDRYVIQDYFSSGLILANIIISVLLLVGWLVSMFKNNAFKNYYPTSNLKLFGQFLQYFIIVFISTTFYFSYIFGFRTFIESKYDDASMKQKIEIINDANAFLSQEPNSYTLDNKRYPEEFEKLFCETNISNIDYSQKYFNYYDSYYQFNTIYSKTVTEKDSLGRFIYPAEEANNATPLAYSKEFEKECIFYFKKNVVDVSQHVKNAKLNYLNFSNVFYAFGSGSNDYYDIGYSEKFDESGEYITKDKKQNQRIFNLLKSNKPEDLKKLFSNFLEISKEFKIKTNLETNKWMELVYHPESFEVKKFILNHDPKNNDYESYEYLQDPEVIEAASAATSAAEGNTNEDPQVTLRRQFVKENTTSYFYESADLKVLLENIDEVKNNDIFSDSIHVFLWLSFIFSTVIFSFRVTNLRSLLFSIIATGVISLIISLISVVFNFVLGDLIQFFVLYFVLILSLVILIIPMMSKNVGTKLFRSILVNMSINGFVGFVMLIFGIISAHQSATCQKLNAIRQNYVSCNTLIDDLDKSHLSYLLILCGFIFMFFYVGIVKKWKASPE